MARHVHDPRARYAERRRVEYPPVHEQMEALTEAAAGRPEKLEALQERIAAIKAAYPKPPSPS